MTQMRFEPGSWERSAAAFDEVSSAVSGAKPPAAGAGGGPTSTDAAVATVLSQLDGVVQPVFPGLGGGLSADAEIMRSTAQAYSRTEEQNQDAGTTAGVV